MEQNKSIHKSPAIDPVRDLCNDEEYQKYVAQKLAEAEEYAARPDAVWHNFDDVAREIKQNLSEKNENVIKTVGVYAKLSVDEATRMLAEAREKEIQDQISREYLAREEGKQEGKLEGKLETARNLLDMGFSLADTAKATGLSESELARIKQ